MKQLNDRRDFLKKTCALAAGVAFAPTYISANQFGQFGDLIINGKPVNKLTPNSKILNLWGQRSKAVNHLYNAVHEYFMRDGATTYAQVAADPQIQTLLKQAAQPLLGGPMLGVISSDSVSVWVRTIKPEKVTIKTVDEKGKEKIYPSVFSSIKSDLTAIINLDNLDAGLTYTYEVYLNNHKVSFINRNLCFHTTQKQCTQVKGRIVFGSCYHRWGLGNMEQTNQILKRKPDAMLLLGDVAVQDKMGNAALHRDDYYLRDLIPAWQKLVSTIPVYETWDDHDYMNNDLAGVPEHMNVADKEHIWEVFKNVWNNPSYGFGDKKKGVFLKTTIGSADVIMVDNRYFRKNKKGSFLGEEQMIWLKKKLLECKSPFIILSCGTMWTDYVSGGKDSWGVNDPEGRDMIFDFIQRNNIKGVLLISGDRHGARGFAVPLSKGFKLYEFGGASLGSRVGPPATDPLWTNQMYGISGKFAFSEFTFAGTSENSMVTFNLIGDDGTIIFTRSFTRNELTPSKI